MQFTRNKKMNDMKLIMENWRRSFLKEENEEGKKDIDGDSFTDAKDFDHFPDGKERVGCLFFDKKQMYEKEQQTHGLLSHALKHSHEPGLERADKELQNVISNFIKLLSAEKYKNIEIYHGIWGDNKKPVSRETFKPDKFVIINTIDRINDARLTGQKLLPIERDIMKLTKNLSAAYLAIAKDVIKNPDAKQQSKHDSEKWAFVKGEVVVLTYSGNISSAMGSCRKGPPQECLAKFLGEKLSGKERAAIAAKKREKSRTRAAGDINKSVGAMETKRQKAEKAIKLSTFAKELKTQGKSDAQIVTSLVSEFGIHLGQATNIVNPKRKNK